MAVGSWARHGPRCDRRRRWPQRSDLRHLPRQGRDRHAGGRGPVERRRVRQHGRRPRRPREHLQLRPHDGPHHAGARRARPRPPRAALPRRRPGPAEPPLRRWSGVARVPRRRAHPRRPAAHLPRPGRRLPALRGCRAARRPPPAGAGQPAAHARRRAADGRRAARPRCRHAAALEPDERRRRVRQLLHRRRHQRAGHRGGTGRVGPRSLHAGHRARCPHLRHEACRPGRPARRAGRVRCRPRCSAPSRQPAGRCAATPGSRPSSARASACVASSSTTARASRRRSSCRRAIRGRPSWRGCGTLPSAAEPLVARWRATAHRDGYESKVDAVVAEAPTYHQTDAELAADLGYDPLVPTTIVVALAGRDRPRPPRHGRRSRGRPPDAVRQRPVGARPVHAGAGARRRPRAQPRGALHPVRPAGRLDRYGRAATVARRVRRPRPAGLPRRRPAVAGHDARDATRTSSSCRGATPPASRAGRWPPCGATRRSSPATRRRCGASTSPARPRSPVPACGARAVATPPG